MTATGYNKQAAYKISGNTYWKNNSLNAGQRLQIEINF